MKMLMVSVLLWLACHQANACSTPVFQYALERWEPDPFMLYYINQGKHDEKTLDQVKQIEKHFSEMYSSPALITDVIEDPTQVPSALKKHFEHNKLSTYPLTAITFPTDDRIPYPLLCTTPDKLDTTSLLHSPQRSELAKRLGQGQTAVWILLRSGDKEKDQAAIKVIQDTFTAIIPGLQEDIEGTPSGPRI